MSVDSSGAARLREQLARGELIAAPGAYDPYSARLLERFGFPALYLGGNALGLQLAVGQPFVTMTETADATRRITRVTRAPLIVDVGAGFGDAAHASVTLRALAQAGAAAVHLDDQVYPKRAHYHRGVGRLAAASITCGKLRAMREEGARVDGASAPVLVARTDALRVTRSLDETIDRCGRYLEAGAEALMVLDLGPADAARLRSAFASTPLAWIGGIAEPVPTAAELARAGFALALYPFNSIAAVTTALTTTWAAFQREGRPARPTEPAPATLAHALDLIDMATHWETERRTTEAGDGEPAPTPKGRP
ncbi:MAG TPA: isocitrate lyase/PEP mutase family protein [Burkholderiaceae bacterium]|jgi:methylisocitrate lyase